MKKNIKLISKVDDSHACRSVDALINHYLVEKEIAQRLKQANRQERKKIYATMYEELFAKVPDHPRLTRPRNTTLTRRLIRNKLSLVLPFIHKKSVVLEFGPGDCVFAKTLAQKVKKVYALDISDQTGESDSPENFELMVYDGERVDLPEGVAYVAFSDQLIEHIHPEETTEHFKLAHRLLKSKGKYIFRTPPKVTGPHDISRFFSEHAEGFHLKEWTFHELRELALNSGFNGCQFLWYAKQKRIPLPFLFFHTVEKLLLRLGLLLQKKIGRYLIPSITMVVTK